MGPKINWYFNMLASIWRDIIFNDACFFFFKKFNDACWLISNPNSKAYSKISLFNISQIEHKA